MPLTWAARLLGTPAKGRVSGTDMVWHMARLSAESGFGIAMIGGRYEITAKAAEVMRQAFPRITSYNVCYTKLLRTGVANLAADKIVERLVELRLQEQKLLARYQEDAVPVASVRQEIAEAEGLLRREKRTLTQSTTALNVV